MFPFIVLLVYNNMKTYSISFGNSKRHLKVIVKYELLTLYNHAILMAFNSAFVILSHFSSVCYFYRLKMKYSQ